MSGRALRRCWRAFAASTVAVTPVLAIGCVADPIPRSSPGTTTFASRMFCEPLRALSVDAWADQGARALVAADLAAARNHAPASLHRALDTLVELEKAGVHPAAASTPPGATAGTEVTPLGRWHDAMNTLSEVAERECDVDLTAGAGAGSIPDAPLTDPSRTPTGAALTPEDVVALVRSGRPGARWLDRDVVSAVSSGESVQVAVVDIDDDALAKEICDDLLAVLPPRAQPAQVTVRNAPGFVVVATTTGECAEVPHP